MTTETPPKPAPLESDLVHEFVQVAHFDLEAVKRLLAQQPALLNAANDWGGGDWETALGAAAHMGRRDIALFLIGEGAPLDLFAAAMLGHLDVVKSIVAAFPYMKNALGPHKIPLKMHAKAGGAEAEAVLAYLEGGE
jgi:hypothetical protein